MAPFYLSAVQCMFSGSVGALNPGSPEGVSAPRYCCTAPIYSTTTLYEFVLAVFSDLMEIFLNPFGKVLPQNTAPRPGQFKGGRVCAACLTHHRKKDFSHNQWQKGDGEGPSRCRKCIAAGAAVIASASEASLIHRAVEVRIAVNSFGGNPTSAKDLIPVFILDPGHDVSDPRNLILIEKSETIKSVYQQVIRRTPGDDDELSACLLLTTSTGYILIPDSLATVSACGSVLHRGSMLKISLEPRAAQVKLNVFSLTVLFQRPETRPGSLPLCIVVMTLPCCPHALIREQTALHNQHNTPKPSACFRTLLMPRW